MKSFILTICLLAVAIPSSSVVVRSTNSTQCESSASNMQSMGAAYFMTNEPSGNFIISSAIGADGKLFSPRAIATGGVGARGLTPGSPPSSDATFGQGAIESSAAGILAAVNLGSDTVSIFSISESDPSSLAQIGSPVWTRGQFPISVAFNKAGDVLCILNAGFISSISCFKADKAKGLTSIPDTTRYLNLNQTTPPSGPVFGSASQVIFSEDNKLLIVAVKGNMATNQTGYLAVWDVYENNSLSEHFNQVAAPQGGSFLYSLTLVAGQNAILATDVAVGYDIFTNMAGSWNTTSSTDVRSVAIDIPNQQTTCWSTYSPKTGNYYLSDAAENRIVEVSVDANLTSAIVNYYTLQNSSVLEMATASVEDGEYVVWTLDIFLYVVSAIPRAVDVFSLDGPGKAEYIQRLDVAGFAKSVGITIDTNYVAGMTTFV